MIEVVLVVAILGVIVTLLITSFTAFNRQQALDKDTQLVVETLREARSKTLNSQNAQQYGVYFASTTITLFSGTTYSSSAPTNQSYLLNTQVTISSVALTGSGTTIVFERLSGETNQNGVITLLSPATSMTKTVTIYKTGVVEAN